MWKKCLWRLGAVMLLLFLSVGAGGYWLFSFNPDEDQLAWLQATKASELPYLKNPPPELRGRILAVVTSTDRLGATEKYTGYELTELSRAYWVFKANGFAVDIASPRGGNAPRVLDGDDMGAYDYAFLNDPEVNTRLENTLPLASVKARDYRAIYFVGGKGTMFDFPDNPDIKRLLASFAKDGKVIAAVCHGPAALLNVKVNGQWLVADRSVSAFTNSEELLLIPEAETIFPFLLESQLKKQGARFAAGPDYLRQTVRDRQLITGQNPWSVWAVAEEVITALGYTPKKRPFTPEEHSVQLLLTYEHQGLSTAQNWLAAKRNYDSRLLAMHGLVAAMKLDVNKALHLFSLAEASRR